MAQANDGRRDSEFDIFVMNFVYPDATELFTFRLKPIEEIEGDCIFVLDTNALLVPYATSQESLDVIKPTYERLIGENRLFIPGQVAREFVKNRSRSSSSSRYPNAAIPLPSVGPRF